MHRIMRILHEDHVNVARLLDLMDDVFEQVRRGDQEKLHLAQKSMRYMTAYPDIYHHPAEDLVFKRLVAKAPETRAVADRLHEEHGVIGKDGTMLLALLKAAVESDAAPESVLKPGGLYIERLRVHMNTEEGDVFPLVKVILTADDWDNVATQLASGEDPLFGPQLQKSYRDLAKNLGNRSLG